MTRRRKAAGTRSFPLTMSMRTFNDLAKIIEHVEATTRGDLKRRAMMARARLERAQRRAAAANHG